MSRPLGSSGPTCRWRLQLAAPLLVLSSLTNVMAAQQGTQLVELREDLRISAEKMNLSAIGGVAIGRDGRIAVGQGQDGAIRLFSHDGRSLGIIGRKGSGPGEVERLSAFGWLGEDVWLYDGKLRRVTIFEQSGKVIRSVRVPTAPPSTGAQQDATGFISLGLLQLGPNGTALFRATGPRGVGKNLTIYTWGSIEGVLGRTVAEVPTDPCVVVAKDAAVAIPLCSQNQSQAAPAGEGVVFLETTSPKSGEYQLTRFDANGRLIYQRKYAGTVRAVSASARDSVLKATIKGFPASEGILKAAGAAIPTVWPVVRHMFVGAEGTVWVQMSQDPSKGQPYEWRRYDERGMPTGIIRLPRDTRVVASNRQGIYVIEADLDGIESIVRFNFAN